VKRNISSSRTVNKIPRKILYVAWLFVVAYCWISASYHHPPSSCVEGSSCCYRSVTVGRQWGSGGRSGRTSYALGRAEYVVKLGVRRQ
jgi:hypothetical protein